MTQRVVDAKLADITKAAASKCTRLRKRELLFLAQMRSTDRIGQCLGLGAKRNISARAEYFAS
ncbi:hypothetical protein XI09_10095 [Bradyrhizobium sp. CCBAU 11386]|nr:hypothetical protein [Bradyrhizobium sp. CCBAU 11386]